MFCKSRVEEEKDKEGVEGLELSSSYILGEWQAWGRGWQVWWQVDTILWYSGGVVWLEEFQPLEIKLGAQGGIAWSCKDGEKIILVHPGERRQTLIYFYYYSIYYKFLKNDVILQCFLKNK